MPDIPHCDNCGEYPGSAISDEIDRLRGAITAARERLVASRFTNSEHSQAMRILDEALRDVE